MNEKDFINNWIKKIESNFQSFPNEYLRNSDFDNFELPGKPLTLGSELFGQFELVDIDGNPFHQTDDYNFIKYILYSNRLKPSSIPKPKKDSEIAEVVKKYETYLDSILKEIKTDLSKLLPSSDFVRITNQIFSALNLQRY